MRRTAPREPRAHWILLLLGSVLLLAELCLNGYVRHVGAERSAPRGTAGSATGVPAEVSNGGPVLQVDASGQARSHRMPPCHRHPHPAATNTAISRRSRQHPYPLLTHAPRLTGPGLGYRRPAAAGRRAGRRAAGRYGGRRSAASGWARRRGSRALRSSATAATVSGSNPAAASGPKRSL